MQTLISRVITDKNQQATLKIISIHTLAWRVTVTVNGKVIATKTSIHTLTRRVTVPAFSPDVTREKCHKIANLFFRLLKIVGKDNKIPINPYVTRGANLLGIGSELGVRTFI